MLYGFPQHEFLYVEELQREGLGKTHNASKNVLYGFSHTLGLNVDKKTD